MVAPPVERAPAPTRPVPSTPTEESAAQPSVSSSPPGRSRRLLWPALCFLQVGLLIGGYVLSKQIRTAAASHAEEAPTPSEHPRIVSPDHIVPPPASSDPDDLDRGDKLIRSGRFDLALPVFRGFGPTVAPPLHDLIQYRIGLCLEGMGRWDEAVATYRGLLTQGQNVRVTAAAQVAQARIAFQRGRPEEIQDLLCRMLLHSARYTKHCSAALEEAQFLLAFALTRAAAAQAQSSGRARTPGQMHMELGEPTAITFSIARALGWADPPLETERPTIHEPAPPGVAVLKLVAPPEESSLRASVAPMPIPQLLDQLAAVCGLKTEWTVRARDQVKAHEVDVEVENVPFLDVVQNVAGPFQLTWKIQQGVVSWAAM